MGRLDDYEEKAYRMFGTDLGTSISNMGYSMRPLPARKYAEDETSPDEDPAPMTPGDIEEELRFHYSLEEQR